MKKTKNVVISLLVLAVALATIAMSIAGMFGKFRDVTEPVGTYAAKHFSDWKDMDSSMSKNFLGLVFFGGVFSLAFSGIVALLSIKWVIKSFKGDFNVGFFKFIGLLVLCAAAFAVAIAVVACADTLSQPTKWDGTLLTNGIYQAVDLI